LLPISKFSYLFEPRSCKTHRSAGVSTFLGRRFLQHWFVQHATPFPQIAQILQRFLPISRACAPPGTAICGKRWNVVMNNSSNGALGIIVGGVVAVIAAIFILSGGELGGKKTVEGDQDLPPIATVDK